MSLDDEIKELLSEEDYNKLKLMEETSPGALASKYVDLKNAIKSYYSSNIPKNDLQDFIITLALAITLNRTKGLGNKSYIESNDFNGVFNMNGFLSRLKGYPNNHYKQTPGAGVPPGPPTSPEIDSDISSINGALAADVEKLKDRINSLREPAGDEGIKTLFGDPTPTKAELSKKDLHNTIFEQMQWKLAYTKMKTGAKLPPPPKQ